MSRVLRSNAQPGRRRVCRVGVVLGVVATLLGLGPAWAYGPGTHLREAETYRERLREGVGPAAAAGDLALLEEPGNWLLFQIGAIFPDVGRRVRDMGFDAHRLDLHAALLEAVSGAEEPALRAFVLGAAQHSMSDAAAQVFFVPALTASTDIGVVDVIVGLFDGPGGENEFFVEAVCDLYEGDLHALVDLYFGLGEGPTREALEAVLVAYYEAAEAVLGDQPLTPEGFAAGVWGFLDSVGEIVGGLGPELAHRLVDDLMRSPASEFFELLTSGGGAFLGLGDVSLGPDDLDRLARARLMAHPFVADRELYAWYGTWFGELGPAFLRDAFATGAVLSEWRTWHGPPLLAASAQSLAWSLPGEYAPEPGVLFWGLGWEGPLGQSLSGLDAADLPDEVALVAELYPSTTRSIAVVLEVRGDRPGLDVAGDPVLATATAELPGLPPAGAPPHRVVVRAVFDPIDGVGEVTGFYAVLRVVGEPRPFLATLEEAWLATEAADLTLPGWRAVFESSPGWVPRLALEGSGATGEEIWLDVHVRNLRYARHGVGDVGLLVEESEAGAVAELTSNAVGRAVWGPAPQGSYRVLAESGVGVALPAPSEWVTAAAGQVEVVIVAVDPEPRVTTSGYTSRRDRVRGRVDDLRFRATQPFEAAVSEDASAPEGGWQALPGRIIDLGLAPARSDGDVVYLFARAAAEDGMPTGPPGPAAAVVVDGSGPEGVALAVPPVWVADMETLNGTLNAMDPHSGVAGFVVRVRDHFGGTLRDVAVAGPSPAAVQLQRAAWMEGHRELVLVPVAKNGAGLETEGEARQVTVEWPTAADGEGDGDGDVGEPDAGDAGDGGDEAGTGDAEGADDSDGDAAASGPGRGGDDGCGCSAAGPGATWAWWPVVLAIWTLARRRRTAAGSRRHSTPAG
jgi:MYXO-CTERM domain-containing protein